MRVPVQWLHEYCAPDLDAHALAQRLAMTGTEVERVEHHGVGTPELFVVGHVLERERHPGADRLSVCVVDVGADEPAQIVCGAPNVAAGQTVAVARPGAVMPDGTTLRTAKLRGLESHGMILSERELQLGEDHDGIMVIDAGPAAGTALAEVVSIATDVLVLEVTPNRPDCLGIYGVAREVAAATGAPLAPPPWLEDRGSLGALSGLEVVNAAGEELCPRFTVRILDGVRVGPSPLWLKARLMACGQRPISNVVDITNYVMLLTGQPMHAFDGGRVAGGQLIVRRARDREQVQTLDGQTRALDSDVVVIDDAQGPTSIAGVMGGARSEVSAATTTVISEAATWNGPNIHATALRLGLRSEASSRFEKGLAPEQTLWGQAVATGLFIELCGATVRPGTIDVGGVGPAPVTLHLRDARITGLLGMAIERERCRELLETIGFSATEAGDGLDVTVPDFRRADITREVDLIEEVARLAGLEGLPATLPARHAAFGRLTPAQRLRRRAEDVLAGQGLREVVGWSFAAPELSEKLLFPGPDGALALANPMSAEQSRLRTTLLGSLLDVAALNRARGAGALGLFESGAVYQPRQDGDPGPAHEPHHLGVLLAGPVRAATWREQHPRQHDFFAAKGVLSGLFDSLGIDWSLAPADGAPFLHPGRAATVLAGGMVAGWLGELHPQVAGSWGFEETLAAFELELSSLEPPPTRIFSDLVSFPEVREDVAIVVAERVSAGELLQTIRRAAGPLLRSAEVFDVYRDEQRLGHGRKSVAVRLGYQAPDRTLTDAEVAQRREAIIAAVDRELGGRIRAA